MIYLMNLLKNIKRFSLFLCLLLLFFGFSCKENEVEREIIDHTTFPSEAKGLIKNKKIYVTSIGQANDAYMFDYKYNDNLDYEFDMTLKASSVEENSVVFIFVGCSIKALTESDITVLDEQNRIDDFIKLKNEKKISLIGFHLGGINRRGSTSDSLIEKVFSSTIFNLYVSSGNQDHYLSNISEDNHIPCLEVSSTVSLEQPLKLLLGVE